VELPDQVVADARRRLHRAAGQLDAVDRTLAEGRECRDVVMQLSAATQALEQVGFRILAAGLTYCVAHPDDAAERGYPIEEVQGMFMKPA
jgi:DNA-binding FrmR family transcriptional regulator